MKSCVRKTNRKIRMGKRIPALILCTVLGVGLSACGKGGDTTGGSVSNNGAGEQDGGILIYEPEDLKLGNDGKYSMYNVQFLGDMFYTRVYLEDEETGGAYVLRCQSLKDDNVTDMPMTDYTNAWTLGEDGSLYTVSGEVSGGEAGGNFHLDRFLVKQTKQGEQVFRQDITDRLSEDEFFQTRMAVDAEGRIYLLSESRLFLFDEKGSPNGTVNLNLSGKIYDRVFGRGSDGKVYLSDGSGNTTLYEIDYEAGRLGTGYQNFPAREGSSLTWDADGNYLTVDSVGVYRYNLKTQKEETVFAMADTGIDAVMSSAAVSGLSDGRIAIVWQSWETGDNGVVLMTGKSGPQSVEEQKQELVVGVMNSNPFLTAAVSEFNKKNDAYHITVKTYMRTGEIYLIDGVTRLQTDIAAGNSPDIIEIKSSVMDWKNLVKKGAFEDLTPYLEQSEVLNREDFFENVLDAYTYEGVLVTIPAVIQIQGFLGSSRELGGKKGWTIGDVIAFSDAHPEAELLSDAASTSIMRFCLSYSMDSFVDWEKGTCSFDSEEFKRLLEFAARFSDPLAAGSAANQKPWRDKVRDGELLLMYVDMYEVENIQVYADPFPDYVTVIGYPSSGGSPVYTFSGSDSLAISAGSEAKEAAWDFIENYLTRDGNRYTGGFSVIKQRFDEMAEKAMELELDEYGNEIKRYLSLNDGQIYEYRIPTQEEIDMVLYMIEHGRLEEFSSTQLLNIISEEADAFFQGQKTVDQVAETIQRRAAIYVSEK